MSSILKVDLIQYTRNSVRTACCTLPESYSTAQPAADLNLISARTAVPLNKMRPPLRIAVLECDTPLPNTHAKYGGYGGVFESLLRASAKKLNDDNGPYQLDPDRDLQISKWNIVDEDKYPNLEDIDAILISGSSALISYSKLSQV